MNDRCPYLGCGQHGRVGDAISGDGAIEFEGEKIPVEIAIYTLTCDLHGKFHPISMFLKEDWTVACNQVMPINQMPGIWNDPPPPIPPANPKVVDLMAALEESLARAKAAKK